MVTKKLAPNNLLMYAYCIKENRKFPIGKKAARYIGRGFYSLGEGISSPNLRTSVNNLFMEVTMTVLSTTTGDSIFWQSREMGLIPPKFIKELKRGCSVVRFSYYYVPEKKEEIAALVNAWAAANRTIEIPLCREDMSVVSVHREEAVVVPVFREGELHVDLRGQHCIELLNELARNQFVRLITPLNRDH